MFWQFLNIICWNYDETKQEYYRYLLKNLHQFIPCELCQEHYQSNISKLDIEKALSSNENMNLFIVQLHNLVNKSNVEREWRLDEHVEKNIIPLLQLEEK